MRVKDLLKESFKDAQAAYDRQLPDEHEDWRDYYTPDYTYFKKHPDRIYDNVKYTYVTLDGDDEEYQVVITGDDSFDAYTFDEDDEDHENPVKITNSSILRDIEKQLDEWWYENNEPEPDDHFDEPEPDEPWDGPY